MGNKSEPHSKLHWRNAATCPRWIHASRESAELGSISPLVPYKAYPSLWGFSDPISVVQIWEAQCDTATAGRGARI